MTTFDLVRPSSTDLRAILAHSSCTGAVAISRLLLVVLGLLLVCAGAAAKISKASKMGKRPSAKAGAAPSKRPAIGSESRLDSPLARKVLSAEHITKIKSEFDGTAGKPYSHCIIDGLCTEDRLRAVHDELVNNLSANLKESDLFKVYQTCDLANLGRNGVLMELAEKMPQLIALRDSLYSEEFKAMIQEVTGCGELGDHVDCATNLHTTGCHLLCHDDVIGTRKVSFIIYLTSPDEEWTAEDGGALEIYPSVSEGTPDIVPLKTVLPLFNTMVRLEQSSRGRFE